MDVMRIAVRALIAFVYLFILTRASGKRMISEATPFDFVVSLILGDLIDDALWAEVSIVRFAAAAGSIFLCDAIAKTIGVLSRRGYCLLNGRPAIVLRDGVEDGDRLRREQLNEGDLEHLLRMHGIARKAEIRLGVVERDHHLSVLRLRWAEPATRADAEGMKDT